MAVQLQQGGRRADHHVGALGGRGLGAGGHLHGAAAGGGQQRPAAEHGEQGAQGEGTWHPSRVPAPPGEVRVGAPAPVDEGVRRRSGRLER